VSDRQLYDSAARILWWGQVVAGVGFFLAAALIVFMLMTLPAASG
jgi:hypothetical protein